MPITLDKKVETVILETASRSHSIFINGEFVGISRGKRQLKIPATINKSIAGTIKSHDASMKIGKRAVATIRKHQRPILFGFVNAREKEETLIENFLDSAVKDNGYKEAISSFLAGFGHTKLEEYRKRFQNLNKNYKLSIEKYKENYKEDPKFKGFKNFNYLFIEDSKILLTILDVLVKKEEIPHEIYEKLGYIDKLNALRFLKRNWDSYGAPRINPKIISQAIEFIEGHQLYYNYLDFVAPLNNGGVHLAYEKNNKQIKINFDSDDDSRVKIKTAVGMTIVKYKKPNYDKILKDNL